MAAAGVTAAALVAATAPGAPAQAAGVQQACGSPIVTGVWRTSQSNDYHPVFTLTQDGSYVSGSVELPEQERARAGFQGRVGTVEGIIDGNQLDLVVAWPPKFLSMPYFGYYSGTIINGTIVDGIADDLMVDNTATWTGSGPNVCATGAGAASVSGTWDTTQGNNYHPTFALTQSGSSVSGTAYLSESERVRGGYVSASGSVSGTFDGSTLDVVVTWTKANGAQVRGRYTGTIVNGQIVNGRCYDLANPSASTSWTGGIR